MSAAVLYAAKSTADRRRSIATQLEDAAWKCEEEGWEVVGRPFSDEGFSAYRGDRGPDLADAIKLAAAEAKRRGEPVMLVAQAVDRFARGAGDAPGAARHASELWHELRRRNVHMRTAEDDEATRDAGSIAAAGEAAMRESRRRSSATRKGLRRRKDRGEPVGALPVGYRVEHVVVDGEPTTRRVLDDQGAALYERMVADSERGLTPGSISRALNADGHLTTRGKPWTTRSVRRVLENDDYLGGNGYPALIDRDRWEALQRRLARKDAAAVQARNGGRPAGGDVLLAGVAFCSLCGAPMRHRRLRPRPGPTYRYYRCRNTMEGIGTCDASAVPAGIVEDRVIEHLERVADEQLRRWLADRAEEHRRQRDRLAGVVDRERAQLRQLDRRRESAAAQYDRLLDADSPLADRALLKVAEVEEEMNRQRRRLEDAEARAAEFTGEPDERAALETVERIADALGERLRDADGPREVNAVLRDALAGVYIDKTDRGMIYVEIVATTGQWTVTEGWDTAAKWLAAGKPEADEPVDPNRTQTFV